MANDAPPPAATSTTPTDPQTAKQAIEHIVYLMLENRSFDHLLGYLYTDSGNVTPSGHPYEGLTGHESNLDANGQAVSVWPITPDHPNAYLMPGVNPGEGYARTNVQLFGSSSAPAQAPDDSQVCVGFVQDFAQRIATSHGGRQVQGTQPRDIMGCYTPQTLPILNGLAKGFAVCDHWFGSAPTETMPNRAFALAATSMGQLGDPPRGAPVPTYKTPSIFGSLTQAQVSWAIYGSGEVLTRNNFPDTVDAADSHFSHLAAFKDAARDGTLPSFCFIEPGWSGPGQNDQHPVSDVSAGERLIADIYNALRTGKNWNQTLLIITYDEHGGCYDHVAPPWGQEVVPPDHAVGEQGFDFRRLGPRVPAVVVSPWIGAGTVFRAPEGAAPIEHTCVLKLLQSRFGLAPLSARDAAACDLWALIDWCAQPRSDDPLSEVITPWHAGPMPQPAEASHIQLMHAQALEAHAVANPDGSSHAMPAGSDTLELDNYIRSRGAQVWSRRRRSTN